jgi:phosphatidate cytidylyltransferase
LAGWKQVASLPPARRFDAKRFDWGNLRLRVISAATLAPAALGLTWLGGWPFMVLVSVAASLLAIEWGLMAAPERPARIAIILTAAMLPAIFAGYFNVFGLAWILLLAGAVAVGAVSRWYGLVERPLDVVFGALYLGGPGLALIWLRSGGQGLAYTILMLSITWSADIAAFAAGNLFKGPKLWPRISPNKTWSGFIAGLIGAMLAGYLASLLFSGREAPSGAAGAAIGLAAGLATMAGDLWESLVKRRFGVKDSGDLIPGHGGLLDRVDGMMFAVLAVAGARLLHVGSAAA